MSQPRPKGKPQSPPPPSPLPGIISAAVVLVVLGLVVGLLIRRSGSDSAAQPAVVPPVANNSATDSAAIPSPAVAAPTVAQAPQAPVSAETQPTASSYSFAAAPPMSIDPAKQYTATIATPRGDIVVELLPDVAPQTVNNFVFLARENFYNGLQWHRVLPNFMAQGGDPLGDGTGGPGYSIPAEFSEQITFDAPGLVAMARSSDPDSAGSQFFITTGPAPFLDGQYTIFGRVVSGQEIVNGIPLRDPENPADLATLGEAILGVTISEP